jgi:pimeloyl-ACP methyl ester carboxylesterase
MRQPAEGFALACETLARSEPVDLGQIGCPVLAVTGDQDGVAPPANIADIADRVRGARTAVLTDCGHWTPVEKPKDCNRLAAEFLRN